MCLSIFEKAVSLARVMSMRRFLVLVAGLSCKWSELYGRKVLVGVHHSGLYGLRC